MSVENKYLKCDVCGEKIAPEDDARMVFALPRGYHLCSECLERLYLNHRDTVEKHRKEQSIKRNGRLTPRAIKEFMDKYVIGQDHPKVTLANAVYNHYKGIAWRNRNKNNANAVEIEKSNILLLGATGSGKTHCLKTIARFLQVPFVVEDASSFSQTGFVGRDVDQIIQDLLEAADGDVAKAEKGIVFLDEIDKLSRKGESANLGRDVSGEGVQQALLKLVEGNIVNVAPKGQRITPSTQTIKVNTENILFIVGGSFEGIEKIIAKRLRTSKSTIGFGASLKAETDEQDNLMLKVKAEDFRKFGIIPELLGRLPIICPFEELTRKHLVRILTEPKNALVRQYQALFSMEHAKLEFSEAALNCIADKAIERKTGARGLRSIVEEALGTIMFDIPECSDTIEVVVDADENNELVIRKEGETYDGREEALSEFAVS